MKNKRIFILFGLLIFFMNMSGVYADTKIFRVSPIYCPTSKCSVAVKEKLQLDIYYEYSLKSAEFTFSNDKEDVVVQVIGNGFDSYFKKTTFMFTVDDRFDVGSTYSITKISLLESNGNIIKVDKETNEDFFKSNIYKTYTIYEETPVSSISSANDDEYTYYHDLTKPLKVKLELNRNIDKLEINAKIQTKTSEKKDKKITAVKESNNIYSIDLLANNIPTGIFEISSFDVYIGDKVYHYKTYTNGNADKLVDNVYYYSFLTSIQTSLYIDPLNDISLKSDKGKLNEKVYLNLKLNTDVVSGSLKFKQNDRTLTVPIYDINTDFPYIVIPYTSPLGEVKLDTVSLKVNAANPYALERGEMVEFTYNANNEEKEYYYSVKREFSNKLTIDKDDITIKTELLNIENDKLNDEIYNDIKKVDEDVTINLDANNKSLIDKKLFELIKGKDITLIIHNNSNKITINGRDVEEAKEFDSDLLIGELDKLMSNKVKSGLLLTSSNKGKLPGKMRFSIENTDEISKVLEGEAINLYKYNEKEDKFEVVKGCIELTKDGFYEFDLDTSARYVITNSKIADRFIVGYVSNLPIIMALIAIPLTLIAVIAIVIINSRMNKKGKKNNKNIDK